MAKKKKEILEEEIIEVQEEQFENYEDEDDTPIVTEDDEEVIDSSLEIGGQIHKQDAVIKKVPYLPKDLKYSRFDRMALGNFMYKAKTYDLYRYVTKIQNIAKEELKTVTELRKGIYDIETPEDLREYLKKTGKAYLWESFRHIAEEDFKLMFETIKNQLKEAKERGVVDYLYEDRNTFYNSYNTHLENYKDVEVIDDFGIFSSMMTNIESNKAVKGWGMESMNTTINITRNEDISKDVEEEPEDSENQARGFFKK